MLYCHFNAILYYTVNALLSFLETFLAISGTMSRRSATSSSWPDHSINCFPLSELCDGGLNNRCSGVAWQLFTELVMWMGHEMDSSLDWCTTDKGMAGVFTGP